jgi:hypothetical protein
MGWLANGNILLGMSIGALVSVAIGWFIAAAALQKKEKK